MTAIHCSDCGSLRLDQDLNSPEYRECSGCGSQIQARIFPAYYRTAGPVKTESVVEGESSCFFHPKKQAVVPCDECGRFLCSLCTVELGARNVCPGCINTGPRKGTLAALENRRQRYDSIALAVAVLPAFFIFPTLLSAPAALYLSASHWNDPAGILPRTRWRFMAAFSIALLQILAWVFLVFYLIANRGRLFP